MKYLILLLFLINYSCSSQVIMCDTISKKSVYYVSFEIKSKENYPVRMAGIFDEYKLNDFSKKDAENFVKSFYEKGVYTPLLIQGYKKILNECLTPSKINFYLKKNSTSIDEIANALETSSIEEITLQSGDKVFLRVLNIGGTFFKTSKNNKGIFSNSMEWDIKDINEIKEVFIPFDNLYIHVKK